MAFRLRLHNYFPKTVSLLNKLTLLPFNIWNVTCTTGRQIYTFFPINIHILVAGITVAPKLTKFFWGRIFLYLPLIKTSHNFPGVYLASLKHKNINNNFYDPRVLKSEKAWLEVGQERVIMQIAMQNHARKFKCLFKCERL